MYMDKRRKYDWLEIQKFYDVNLCTMRMLSKHFGVCMAAIWKASIRGEIILRNNSSAGRVSTLMGRRPDTIPADVRRKISETVHRHIDSGNWHVSLAKNMWKEYNGVKFHGSWEVEYAKWLNKNSIKWRRPIETFTYQFEGKSRRYTPDFYLLDEQIYVEIKGYETEKDRAKWSQFPLKHRVLKKKDLIDIGISVK